MNFEEAFANHIWLPIRNCPGRFVLRTDDDALPPETVIGVDAGLEEFRVAAAKDTVVVGRLDGGGLISYQRDDGSYLHTLNTADGFERKLKQLGIVLRQ
jgi:hypothetical protein